MRIYSRLVQARLVRRAQSVITVSKYSKRQIVARFELPPERVVVIYEAPSAHYRPLNQHLAVEQVERKYGFRGYILAFASAAPRKNIGKLMEAYARLEEHLRQQHPLVLICTHFSEHSRWAAQAAALGLSRDVILVDRVTDDDLLLLYNAASLFVFPSLEEGFGLPPLEAMACGTPVVASNTSSMPEVLGDAALLVSPTDTDALTEAMTTVLTTPALAEQLAQRGLAHSQRFSWEKTARQTLAVYESVARMSS